MTDEWTEAESRYERAQRLSEAQRWGDALGELDAALEINPGNGGWHGIRGYVLDQLQRYGEAIEAYRAALQVDPNDRETLVALAVDLARTDRCAEALSTLEGLAELHPDYEPAYCYRILIYAQIGQHEAAEEMFYLAQQLDDGCPHCFFHMGGSLLARDRYDQAIYCLERSLALCPTYPDARRQIAAAYRAKGELNKAKAFYLAELRCQLGDVELLSELAEVCLQTNDLRGGVEKYRLITELDPKEAGAWAALGGVALADGQTVEALELLHQALSCDPTQPGLHAQLGEACLRAGRPQNAARHLALALEQEPDNPRALMALGNCLLQQHKLEEAAEQYLRLTELAPDLPGPYHNLAVCAYLCGRYEEGMAYCRQALERKGDYVMAMEKLALGCLQTGRRQEARLWIRRAGKLNPSSVELVRLRRRWRKQTLAAALLWWAAPLKRLRRRLGTA